jgi:hypothetical protein
MLATSDQARSKITTGISRAVLCWYSSYAGHSAVIVRQRPGFSSGVAVRAPQPARPRPRRPRRRPDAAPQGRLRLLRGHLHAQA